MDLIHVLFVISSCLSVSCGQTTGKDTSSVTGKSFVEQTTEEFNRYCPYTETCITDFNMEDDTDLVDRNIQCCKQCSCLDNCGLNCCPDKLFTFTNEKDFYDAKGLTRCVTAQYNPFYDRSFYMYKYSFEMVSNCPFNYSDGRTVEQCKREYHEYDFQMPLRNFLPAYDQTKHRVYKNIFCAVCHNADINDLDFAFLTYSCENRRGNLTYLHDLTWNVSAEDGICNFLFFPKELSKWVGEICDKNNINQCNVTGKWKKYDRQLEEKCLSYRSEYTGHLLADYKNVHCFLCNGFSENDIITVCNEQHAPYGGLIGSLNFRNVFSKEEDKDYTPIPLNTDDKGYNLCQNKAIYNVSQVQTWNLECPYGMVFSDYTCFPPSLPQEKNNRGGAFPPSLPPGKNDGGGTLPMSFPPEKNDRGGALPPSLPPEKNDRGGALRTSLPPEKNDRGGALPTSLPPEKNDRGGALPTSLPPEKNDRGGAFPPSLPPEKIKRGVALPPSFPPEKNDRREALPTSLPPEKNDGGGTLPMSFPPEKNDRGGALPPSLPPEKNDRGGALPTSLPPEKNYRGGAFTTPLPPEKNDRGGALPTSLPPEKNDRGGAFPPSLPPEEIKRGVAFPPSFPPEKNDRREALPTSLPPEKNDRGGAFPTSLSPEKNDKGGALPPSLPPEKNDKGGALPTSLPTEKNDRGGALPTLLSPEQNYRGGALPPSLPPGKNDRGGALPPSLPPGKNDRGGALPTSLPPEKNDRGGAFTTPLPPEKNDRGGALPTPLPPEKNDRGGAFPPSLPPEKNKRGVALPPSFPPEKINRRGAFPPSLPQEEFYRERTFVSMFVSLLLEPDHSQLNQPVTSLVAFLSLISTEVQNMFSGLVTKDILLDYCITVSMDLKHVPARNTTIDFGLIKEIHIHTKVTLAGIKDAILPILDFTLLFNNVTSMGDLKVKIRRQVPFAHDNIVRCCLLQDYLFRNVLHCPDSNSYCIRVRGAKTNPYHYMSTEVIIGVEREPFCPRIALKKLAFVKIIDSCKELHKLSQILTDDFLSKQLSENRTHIFFCYKDYLQRLEALKSQDGAHRAKGRNVKELVLTYLTIVCLSASVASLLTTLIIYALFAVLRTLPGLNIMALSITLLVYHFFSLVSTITFVDIPWLCNLIGIVTHFFMIQSFGWMLLCTFHMMKVFIKIRSKAVPENISRRFVIHVICAALVATILVAITIIVAEVRSGGQDIGYGGNSCYIKDPVLIMCVAALPVALVVILNFCMFFVVLIKISRLPSLAASKQKERQNIVIFIKLSTLTGLSSIFGFVFLFTEMYAFGYIFVVLNGGQGVFIMISFIFNRRVRDLVQGSRTSSSSVTTSTSKL